MPQISNHSLAIFKDACGLHDFTDVERAHIEVLAEQLKEILEASKERERQRATR